MAEQMPPTGDLVDLAARIAVIASMTDAQRHQLLGYLAGKEPGVIDEAIADLQLDKLLAPAPAARPRPRRFLSSFGAP